MFRSVLKIKNTFEQDFAVKCLFRNMAGQAPQKMEDYFKNKKIIVTGSCAGMGEKITQRLLDLGAFVYAVVEKEKGAAKALPNTKQIFCDVSDWKDTYNKMYEIGPVHGLVNNAGVAVIEPFFDVTENGWNKTLNINARALVRISQAVAKKYDRCRYQRIYR
uniref:L-xylulose reductase n=1 Tax=Melanaphis sacchari TaxID=742174 RepID=A0A2H8TUC9_9HEMI